METLPQKKSSGLNSAALRTWGMIFAAGGIVGSSILQNGILGAGSFSSDQLLELMNTSDSAMAIATAALVLQAIEACAVPIFAFLLVEGFLHTKDWKKYIIRLAGLAVLAEIPFNLATTEKVIHFSTRNPAFALVIGLFMLYLFQRFSEKGLRNTVIKLIVVIAAVIWSEMLSVTHGSLTVIMVAVLWLMRKKPQLRTMVGAVAGSLGCVISPFYIASAMGFLPIHLYNGEREQDNRWIVYLIYPVILLVCGLVGMFMF